MFKDQNVRQQSQEQSKETYLTYELLPQIYIQKKMCWAIALDQYTKFLITGAESNINTMQFRSGAIKRIQTIQRHESWITTLNFFKQMPLFISGSSCIKIWSQNQQANPKFLIKLSEHSSNIQCLALRNLNSRVIISGSKDKNIKFWYQSEAQWICKQTIREHSNAVCGLSLNQEGDTLISCGEDNVINIIKCQDDHHWNVIQKLEGQGVRLSFICKDTFAFQPWQGSKLELYTYSAQTGLYYKYQELPIQGCRQFCAYLFPCFFVSSKNILLSKNGYNLNFIKFKINSSQFEGKLEQAIEFDYPNNWQGNIFGTMSEGGDFLITWDSKTKQIQIRKYKEYQLQNKKSSYKNCSMF
ncbi:unnamed protein product [Paramecium octaurelia]|uniref:Uncharacterized protein n=1 Tax=Paramecium octaurelia TaxID=43137 RepID=A0A8S1WG42_PAROT|nr:unnamed protein product [Paramecium octaurelia]